MVYCCNLLQRVATCCIVFQTDLRVATCCTVRNVLCCNALLRCNVLHCGATALQSRAAKALNPKSNAWIGLMVLSLSRLVRLVLSAAVLQGKVDSNGGTRTAGPAQGDN